MYRLKGNVFVGLLLLETGGLEFAVDSNVGILVKTGIGLETGFGFGSDFDYREIMIKETNTPFERFGRIGMLERVSQALGKFDEFAISYAGCRPSLREMVGIELEKSFGIGHSTDNDVLLVAVSFFHAIHRAPICFIERYRHKITHSPSARCGIGRELHIMVNYAVQTVYYACF